RGRRVELRAERPRVLGVLDPRLEEVAGREPEEERAVPLQRPEVDLLVPRLADLDVRGHGPDQRGELPDRERMADLLLERLHELLLARDTVEVRVGVPVA